MNSIIQSDLELVFLNELSPMYLHIYTREGLISRTDDHRVSYYITKKTFFNELNMLIFFKRKYRRSTIR